MSYDTFVSLSDQVHDAGARVVVKDTVRRVCTRFMGYSREVEPALKALGVFNFLKVLCFQAIGFKSQPAPPLRRGD